MNRLIVPFFVASFLLGNPVLRAETTPASRIQPWTEDRSYWQYGGQPILLVGGSREDNLFQIDDLKEHLDTLAAAGGNYIRNTMSSRDAGNIWPFEPRADGKYDLTRLSDAYFGRFEKLLKLTKERHIIVQIELWDRFDFARDEWTRNPYRPKNNINFTVKNSGLANDYPRHPGTNENRFFFTVPALDDNQRLLAFQHAAVDRMLEIALEYPNVLYCMDNETSGAEAWGAYWAAYIQQRAAERGVVAMVTEMWDDWNLTAKTHRRTFDHPQRYPFVDVSQNNHNKGQTHWDRLQWARKYVGQHPRPVNCVKVYGSDKYRFGNDRDGVERFWRNVVGGCAAVRFHRPPAGLGLNETVRASLRSVRAIGDRVSWCDVTPHQELLEDRQPNEAYVAAKPGQAYIVYFPNSGSVTLNLVGHRGPFRMQWIDLATASWHDEAAVPLGDRTVLTTPGEGHLVAVIWR